MGASSVIGCGGTAICRCRLRRIKNAFKSSTRTKPPTIPPAIAPTGSSVREWSLVGNVIAGVVGAGVVVAGVFVLWISREAKI